jgi:hypothetical protein
VPKNNDQFGAQVLDCILDATENGVVNDVPGNSYDEEIAQSLIEEQLRRNSGVGTTEDHSKWVLPGNQLAPPRHGFIGMALFVSYKTRVPSQKSLKRPVGGEYRGWLLAPGAGSETET